jgi:hypothetical protein
MADHISSSAKQNRAFGTNLAQSVRATHKATKMPAGILRLQRRCNSKSNIKGQCFACLRVRRPATTANLWQHIGLFVQQVFRTEKNGFQSPARHYRRG